MDYNDSNDMENELIKLLSTAKSVKSMFQECRALVYSEISKLQSEYMYKMKIVHAACIETSLNFEKASAEMSILKEQNAMLVQEKLLLEAKYHESSVKSREMVAMLIDIKDKLQAENHRCELLEKKVSDGMVAKLDLQKQINEGDCEINEMGKELNSLRSEKQKLSEEKCDLEIIVAENGVYGQALQEHVDEIESICTTLRDQRDDQHHYFVMKELSLKKEFDQKFDSVRSEKNALDGQLKDMKLEFMIKMDELDYLQKQKEEWLSSSQSFQVQIDQLNSHLKKLQNDLQLETETVKMLSAKNSDLYDELSSVKNDCLKSKALSFDNTTLSAETITDIDQQLKEIYDQKLEESRILSENQINELKKELKATEKSLSKVKKDRQFLEDKIELLESELDLAKQDADSLVNLNISQCHKNMQLTSTKKSKRSLLEHFSDHSDIESLKNSFSSSRKSDEFYRNGDVSKANGDSFHLNGSYNQPLEALSYLNPKSAEKIKLALERANEKFNKMQIAN